MRDEKASPMYATASSATLLEPKASMPHSHLDDATSRHIVFTGDSVFLPFLLAALFSVHSLIAGLALGVHTELDQSAIATSIAIISHKFVEAIAVGANFIKENVQTKKAVAVILLYSCMTPIGILLGMAVTEALQGPQVILSESIASSLGAGSFIYLAFHEMSEFHSSPITKIGLFLLGFFSMALLAFYI